MKRRAVIVGLGRQALEDHVPGLLACDRAELVAICDDNPDVLRQQQQELRIPAYSDFAELFRAERPDFAIVTVPHHLGGEVIEAAAANGIHVLKEKPLAISMQEARRLAGRCADAGIHLMITLQRRFNPIYSSFQQLADQIGTPFLIDARYTFHTADPSDGWRGHVDQAGGGCVIDMGYHIIDMLLWYFGQPDRVLASLSTAARPDRSYDAEDTALIHFAYSRGLNGSLLLSRYIGPKREEITLVGTKGIVHLERGRIRRLTNTGDVVESLTREQAWPAAAACQIDHFCRVLDGARPNLSGPQENLAHMAFIAACYQSAGTGGYVVPGEMML